MVIKPLLFLPFTGGLSPPSNLNALDGNARQIVAFLFFMCTHTYTHTVGNKNAMFFTLLHEKNKKASR